MSQLYLFLKSKIITMKRTFIKLSLRNNEKEDENIFLGQSNQSSESSIVAELKQEQSKEQEHMIQVPATQMAEILKQMSFIVTQMAQNNSIGGISANTITDAIQKGIEGATPRSRGGMIERKQYSRENLPIEDILEKPALFIAFCMTTTIFDDTLKGHTIAMPHFPVRFNQFLRYEDPTKKGQIVTQCLAVVFSKSQADFIRNHTYFNIKYFEKLEQSKTYNTEVVDRILIAFEYVKKLNDFQIKQKCVELGVTITTNNFNELRKELAHKLAQNEGANQSKFLEDYVEQRSNFENIKATSTYS